MDTIIIIYGAILGSLFITLGFLLILSSITEFKLNRLIKKRERRLGHGL